MNKATSKSELADLRRELPNCKEAFDEIDDTLKQINFSVPIDMDELIDHIYGESYTNLIRDQQFLFILDYLEKKKHQQKNPKIQDLFNKIQQNLSILEDK